MIFNKVNGTCIISKGKWCINLGPKRGIELFYNSYLPGEERLKGRRFQYEIKGIGLVGVIKRGELIHLSIVRETCKLIHIIISRR